MASLAPALLVSMPQLIDPNFNRAVILLCRHNDHGAFGLIVNRALVTTGRVVVNVQPPEAPPQQAMTLSTDRELQVWIGGPVEPQRSWILVSGSDEEADVFGGKHIVEGLYLSTSPDLLQKLLEKEPPAYARLIVGYSGWGPGQLEAELHASSWLMSDVDPELIFGTPAEQMWEAAIRRLGADPSALQMSRGVH